MVLRSVTLALTAARLSRFVTSDHLGGWLVVDPAKDWAVRHEGQGVEVIESGLLSTGLPARVEERPSGEPVPDNGWRSKLVSGLECPFCVGFWIGAGVLAADAALPSSGPLRTAWTLGTRALALNYVVGHASARLDFS